MNIEIKKIILKNNISVYIKDSIFPVGCAELSSFIKEGEFYFNRLFVQPKFRRMGFGHILMQQIIRIVDKKKINIVLDINPYGDLNYDQLFKFYQKYNFEEVDDYLIRKYQ